MMAATADTLLVVEEDTRSIQPSGVASQDTAQAGAAAREQPPASGRASPLELLDLEEDARLRQYRQGESLGRGAYGEVFKAMVVGRFMAVKKIRIRNGLSDKAVEKEINALLLEINMLKRLKHPRIVRYHGCIHQPGDPDPALLIFLEFMPGGSIKAVLDKFGPYGLGLARKYTRQILEGLHFLHTEMIVHRDVKGANILIDDKGDAKIADFGACQELSDLHSTMTGGIKSIHGSVFWMAPEVMETKAGRRSDIWSLGCTVIEMLTAEPPWQNLRAKKLQVSDILKAIVQGPEGPPLPEKIPHDCKSFLQTSLVRDHRERPYASQLLEHRFVRQNQDQRGMVSRPAASPEAWGAAG
mmetsp:Transcript_55127/g.131373  ORF Transcript_55127/g.131373 Transcript_55127/m.131373 type:complete len:356 (+) Transcript_55127:57-1124(+)